jgi:hypothetical protein
MLNELAQVVTALNRLGTATGSRHPRINPMGKNRDLLIVCLADDGTPASFTVVPGDTSATLFRVEHGAAGSSFPGFNLPSPLRTLQNAPPQQLKTAVGALLTERKNTKGSVVSLANATSEVFKLSVPCSFTANQEKQFARSVGELVAELQPIAQTAAPQLENLRRLLKLVAKARLTLAQFSDALAQKLATGDSNDRDIVLLIQDILYGTLDWKKRTAEVGTAAYWEQKAKQDKNAHQPVYLDVVHQDHRFKPVAHPETSRLLNKALLTACVSAGVGEGTGAGVDSYSGEIVLRRELNAGLGQTETSAQAILQAEREADYPEVAKLCRLITADTRTVLVDPGLIARFETKNHDQLPSAREVLKHSVQIWASRLDPGRWPTKPIGLDGELWAWIGAYDNFLGYMAGVLPLLRAGQEGIEPL